MIQFKRATISHAFAAADLAYKLWPEHDIDEMTEEFSDLLNREDAAVFLAEEEGQTIGFAQCQLRRDYVEGTQSSPVGYLEGIFVREKYRRQGIARALLKACETWAGEQGCSEFASDCELTNYESFRFHLALGFLEANRIICFTKRIGEEYDL